MATLTGLQDSLAVRLGRPNPSTELRNLLTGALNAAKNRMALDAPAGVSLLHLTGSTWGNYSPSVQGSASAGGTVFTFTGETFLTKNIFAGDILEIGGQRYLITGLSDTTIEVGVPLPAAVTGTATIYRRTVKLPRPGLVIGAARIVTSDSTSKPLERWQYAPLGMGLATALDPGYLTVSYDQDQGAAFVQFYPAPTSATRFVVEMLDVPADMSQATDVLAWPEPALDALLAVAHEIALRWLSQPGPAVLEAAAKERLQALVGFTHGAAPSKYAVR